MTAGSDTIKTVSANQLESPVQDWRNDSRGGGTRPWGPGGKGSPNVSKGPKPPIQILQLLKNSLRDVKRAHCRYILVPPGPTQGMKLMGPGGEGPSRPPPPVSPAMLDNRVTDRKTNHSSTHSDVLCRKSY